MLAVAPLIEPRLLYHRYVYELVPPEAVAVKVPGVVLEQTGELPPPIVAVISVNCYVNCIRTYRSATAAGY